jgi:hypothetical protein
MVVVTKGLAVRDKLRADLQAYLTGLSPARTPI